MKTNEPVGSVKTDLYLCTVCLNASLFLCVSLGGRHDAGYTCGERKQEEEIKPYFTYSQSDLRQIIKTRLSHQEVMVRLECSHAINRSLEVTFLIYYVAIIPHTSLFLSDGNNRHFDRID